MNKERSSILKSLEERLAYTFQDVALLDHALTHRSFTHELACPPGKDNERLEFLGDAVLDLCVSDLLMRCFPDDPEGRLSKRRAAFVNERSLAELAKSFGLGEGLLLGKGEELSGGRTKPSLLANAFEAVVAAIYIDGGFEEVSSFTQRLFKDLVQDRSAGLLYRDYKTLMQEVCQVRFHEVPRYRVIDEYGPDHDKTFDVQFEVADQITTSGTGKSRKEAEQEAARKAFEYLDSLEASERGQGEGAS
jgi:ribonuclease III